LLKSWCIFSYREFYRNLLVILGEFSDWIYCSKINIPNQLLEMFNLDDERIRTHLRKWTANDNSGRRFSYSATIDNNKRTIQPQSICPKQFTLENLVSMTRINVNVGKGWNTPTALDYFRVDNDDTNDPVEIL
jgi:hypothetical protein